MSKNEVIDIHSHNSQSEFQADQVESPRRIEVPPSENLKVSVVVPIYKELNNGNLFRFIDAFTKQQGVSSDDFEIIFVLNNREKDYLDQNEVYAENLGSRVVIDSIADAGDLSSTTIELTEYQASVVKRAKEKHIVVHAIDLTTGVEKNMGLIRNVGTKEAILRFETGTKTGDMGIIAQLDVDSFPDHSYIKEIITQFKERRLGALFAGYERLAFQGDENVFKSTFAYGLMYQEWLFNFLLCKDESTNLGVHGPRMVATVESYKKVDSFNEEMDSDEDFDIARRMLAEVKAEYVPQVHVYIGDRARAEGFDGKARQEGLDSSLYLPTKASIQEMLFRKGILKAYAENKTVLTDHAFLQDFCNRIGVPFNATLWKQAEDESAEHQANKSSHFVPPGMEDIFAEIDREEQVHRQIHIYCEFFSLLKQKPAYEFVTEFIDICEQNVPAKELQLFYELHAAYDHKDRLFHKMQNVRLITFVQNAFSMEPEAMSAQTLALSKKEQEFLSLNDWVLPLLTKVRTNFHSVDEALEYLKQEFPDYYVPYDQTPHRKSFTYFRAVNQFLSIVTTHPDVFPQLTELYSYFS